MATRSARSSDRPASTPPSAPRGPAEARRLDAEARVRQLADIAKGFFANRAYDEVKVEEIAAAAGVSEALVYHYFPTKRELYVAVIRSASEDMAEVIEPDPNLPPLEGLYAALDAYLEYVATHAEGYRTLHEGGIGSDPEIRALRRASTERRVERIAGAIAAGGTPPKALELAVRGWLGFMESACLEWLDTQSVSRDELRELFVQVLVAAALTAWPLETRPPEARVGVPPGPRFE
jgi:AcrR family transcriptional regulator